VTVQKLKAQEHLDQIKKGIKRKITLKENERNAEVLRLQGLSKTKIDEIQLTILNNKEELEKRVQQFRKEETSKLENKGADTSRISVIENTLMNVEKAIDYIKRNEALVIEYKKDKRELFDRIPELKAEKVTFEKKQNLIIEKHKTEVVKLEKKYQEQKAIVDGIQSKINEFKADEEEFIEFKKFDAFINIQTYFSESMVEDKDLKTAKSIISEINEKYYKGIDNFKGLQQSVNAFNGNFTNENTFYFKTDLNSDADFLNFASDLKEFIEEDKINEFEKRVNERFAHIIQLIGRETTELNSKKGDIEKIIKKINDDFSNKNFVEAIKEMEIRTLASSNPIVRLLIKIQEFNDENSMVLGEASLFTSDASDSKNQKAVELLKELVKAIEKYKSSTLTLSESFDLQFKIVENDNDSGWVEKLSNVGSEGTDVLVKAMINILLLNVFKDSASKKFKDFKLHCMMDEIGRLHPNNVKGILRFANERNILLINGSPTSQNATDYKYTYKLAKEQSKLDSKKYNTKINRLVKVNSKVLN
jgi:ribosomal protein L33